jgi:hypothetical protein
MASVTLIHPEKTFTVPLLQATNKCNLFQNNPTLLAFPYRVESSVTLSAFPGLSLGVGRKRGQNYGHKFDRTCTIMWGVWFLRNYREAFKVPSIDELQIIRGWECTRANRVALKKKKKQPRHCGFAGPAEEALDRLWVSFRGSLNTAVCCSGNVETLRRDFRV